MQRITRSRLALSRRSLIRASLTGVATLVIGLAALAQGELVFVRQPVTQQSGWLQDIASSPDGGAITIEQIPYSQDTLLSKIRRDGSVEWNRTVSNTQLRWLDDDAGGDFVACGVSSGDVVIVRLAANGTELWRTVLPPSSEGTHSLRVSDSGDIYVAWYGAWSSSYGPPTYLSKLSSAGTVLWTSSVNSSSGLAVTQSNGAYYSGGSVIGRLNSNGQNAWDLNISSLNIYVEDACVDAQGAGIFCGRAASNSTFGSPIGNDDAIIFRVLPGGAINWVRRFGTPYNDSALCIFKDATGFVVSGETGGRFGGTPNGSADVWICSIDASGNMAWSNQIGSGLADNVRNIVSDSQGGTFVFGNGGPIPGTGATTGGEWIARFGYFDCFADADGDTFGEDGNIVLSPTACSNGLSFVDTDCDDTRVDVYPNAPELCDGVDNDCDGAVDEGFISNYCTAGTSTSGCVATMSSQGAPSRTAGSGFNLICSNVEGQRYGLILYGTAPGAALWAINGTSYICVAPPQGRTDPQTSGGTSGGCNGTFTIDFNLYLATHPNSVGAPYSAGQYLYAQGWYRDPAAPKGTNLSNGIQFAFCN